MSDLLRDVLDEIAATTNPVKNTAKATVKGAHETPSNELPVTIESAPNLTLKKESDYKVYYNNDPIKYTITVTNNDTAAEAPEVQVTDTLPDEITITKVMLGDKDVTSTAVKGQNVTAAVGTIAASGIATIEIIGTVKFIS